MTSKYTNILVVAGALLAFLPIFSVNGVFEGYVRMREVKRLQTAIDRVAGEVQEGVYDGLKAIGDVTGSGTSLCTPTFNAGLLQHVKSAMTLRDMLVENTDGVQYCNAYGDDVTYHNLTAELALPGQSETIAVAELDGAALPVVRISRKVDGKILSAFVNVSLGFGHGVPLGFGDASILNFTLTNGEPVFTIGDNTALRNSAGGTNLVVDSFVAEVPIRAQVIVPFAALKADYADLQFTFTILACAISGASLLALLQTARRTKVHSLELERAIVSGELKPFYQPVIDLTSGRILGCEVLVRWVKRNGQVVPPSDFIDYAEDSGLAIPMTIHLMQCVRRELADLCVEQPGLKVSINLFEGHFRDVSIIEDVKAIFGGSPIRMRQLVFEITERTPFSNAEQANAVIKGLNAIGSRVALDDVGTGHSNLAYLQTLGVDVIKIDRVFIDMIHDGVDQVPVLDGLIAMAKQLGAEIVAEGVETEAQAIYLRERGIVQAQGFLFAPALKAGSFITLARGMNSVAGHPASKASAPGLAAPLPSSAA